METLLQAWPPEVRDAVMDMSRLSHPQIQGRMLGDDSIFAYFVEAVDRMLMRESEDDVFQFLREVILSQRYGQFLLHVARRVNADIAQQLLGYLSDDFDIDLDQDREKARVIILLDDERLVRDIPADWTPGLVTECIALQRGLHTSQLVVDGQNEMRPLQDNVLTISQRQEDWQDDMNSWPQGDLKESLVRKLCLLSDRPLEESPDGTWGGTAEFSSVIRKFTHLLTPEPTRGSRGCDAMAEVYEELLKWVGELTRLPAVSCPKSLLQSLTEEFGI
eukprot:TRINITY_DN49075_c0_g1_i1.p1 TRINITY_DN49075_c0_g1~~TRINITY_DN49075_c0_g1_i1.p1  ORF type:complete len:276 (+),score=48.04 TRINITY_DN49075_c0_g1_i1:70-897(+)